MKGKIALKAPTTPIEKTIAQGGQAAVAEKQRLQQQGDARHHHRRPRSDEQGAQARAAGMRTGEGPGDGDGHAGMTKMAEPTIATRAVYCGSAAWRRRIVLDPQKRNGDDGQEPETGPRRRQHLFGNVHRQSRRRPEDDRGEDDGGQ